MNNTMKRIKRRIKRIVPPRYDKLVELDKIYNGDSPADVLILGDSVMERVSRDDEDTRTLGTMISRKLAPGMSAHVFSGMAYHPTLFRHVILALGAMKHVPKAIVYPINMRCFSPQWYLNPAWQYSREMMLLGQYATMNKRIGRIRPRRFDMDAYEGTSVVYPTMPELKTIGDFLNVERENPAAEPEKSVRKATIFTFHYMHPLDPNDQRLNDIADSVLIARGMNIKVLLYTTPLNITPGTAFMNLADRYVHKNVEVLKGRLVKVSGPNVVFYNWRGAFEPGLFFSRDHATEHLNETGRSELAGMISDKLKDLLGAW